MINISEHFLKGSAKVILGLTPKSPDLGRYIGKPKVAIQFPGPVGGGFGEIAETLLALLERIFGPLALADLLGQRLGPLRDPYF